MENTHQQHTLRRTKTAASWLALIALVLGIHSLIAKPFYIPSESMMPTLRVGDRLVVSKYPYGWSYASASFHVLPFIRGRLFGRTPEPGDIVIVSRVDEAGDSEDFIKRVIGLPGDTVQMVEGRLWLNGKPLKTQPAAESFKPASGSSPCDRGGSTDPEPGAPDCQAEAYHETLPNGRSYVVLDLGRSHADDTVAYKVPAGHAFLMGDNRDNSADSRVPTELGGLGGAVPLESIGGRAEFLTFSTGDKTTWNPFSWFRGFTTERTGMTLRPQS